MSDGYAIEAVGLDKTFEGGLIPALKGADLRVARGEFVAIVGPSGCGKSTLLHLIAALDKPDAGSLRVLGRDVAALKNLSNYRARDVGIVFQLHNLIPSLSAIDNVQVPMFEAGLTARRRRERAKELLGVVGMAGKELLRPTQLSGGERQRVAIARALANEPPVLLADEPTGNLDSEAGKLVLDLLDDMRRRRGLTIVMVTHDRDVAARADRIIRMLDGRVLPDPDERAATIARSAPPAD
ncbi:MAG: ABC transporter ATP-binding protein [Dehalococcoidia bacterium]